MANTKSTETKKTPTQKLEEQIKQQQEQLAEQQAQIEQLLKLMQSGTSQSVMPIATNTDTIGADEEILVISLMPNKLNLVGDGGVVAFSFDHMYEEQYIDYSTLKEIVRLNRQMAKNGRFYIADEKVVNKLRLKNDYKNILSPEQLKQIVGKNVDKSIELYKLAPSGQKHVIVEMVKQAKFNNKNVDYNLLKELSELSGVDLVNVEDATQIETE